MKTRAHALSTNPGIGQVWVRLLMIEIHFSLAARAVIIPSARQNISQFYRCSKSLHKRFRTCRSTNFVKRSVRHWWSPSLTNSSIGNSFAGNADNYRRSRRKIPSDVFPTEITITDKRLPRLTNLDCGIHILVQKTKRNKPSFFVGKLPELSRHFLSIFFFSDCFNLVWVTFLKITLGKKPEKGKKGKERNLFPSHSIWAKRSKDHYCI